MNTWVLVVLFFANQQLNGAHVRFPSEQACKLGIEQARRDFAPQKITTQCILVRDAEPEQQQPKSRSNDA